jgi:hypothetical protein
MGAYTTITAVRYNQLRVCAYTTAPAVRYIQLKWVPKLL